MNNTDATFVNVPRFGPRAAHARLALVLILSSAMGAGGSAYAEIPSAPSVAGADAGGPAGGVVSAPAAPATPAPPAIEQRYSLPWQLRPVTSGDVVRLESAAAVFNDANGNLDEAVTTVLAASYQLTRDWAATARLGFVGNDAPGAAADGSSFANPVVGATYTRGMGGYRLALFGATAIPVGTGAGNAPNLGAAKTNAASTTARPTDSAMFAVNYLTGIVGADFAYVKHGITAQGEAALLQSVRVGGDNSAAATDSLRTKGAVGLHLGYFIGSHFSLGGDLLYQRWLSHPTTVNVVTGAHVPVSDANMDTVTAAVGPRLHFRLGKQAWIRPGIALVRGFDGRGLDAPLLTAQTTALQIDVPIMF